MLFYANISAPKELLAAATENKSEIALPIRGIA